MRDLGIEFTGPGWAALVDIGPAPEPSPTQVLIRTRHSGITNGTERHALLGEHSWAGAFPGRHGYQHVGVVEATGSAVRTFASGDWVFYGQYVGRRAWNLVDVSQADGSHLVAHLPDGLDRRDAALLGVAGVAMRNVRRTRVGRRAGADRAVRRPVCTRGRGRGYGDGPERAAAAGRARAWGARSHRPHALGVLKLGPIISHVVPVGNAPAVYETLARSPGDLLGVVFDWA